MSSQQQTTNMDSELNSMQQTEVRMIQAAMTEFWRTNLKFSRGFSVPLFRLSEVAPLLEVAAEAIVRITHLHNTHLRLNDAHLKDFFSGLSIHNSAAATDSKAFVSGVVKAAFSDTTGAFADGLSESDIDKDLAAFPKLATLTLHTPLERAQIVLETWGKVAAKAKKLMDDVAADPTTTYETVDKIQKALSLFDAAVDREVEYLERHKQQQQKKKESPALSAKGKEKRKKKHTKKNQLAQALGEALSGLPAPALDQLRAEVRAPEPHATPAIAPADSKSGKKSGGGEGAMSPPMQALGTPALGAGGAGATPRESVLREDLQNESKLRIDTISADVLHAQEEVVQLGKLISNIDINALSAAPEAGLKVISALQKKTVAYSEELIRDLLTLDSIVAADTLRPEKKKQTNRITQLMNQLDEFAHVLNSLRSDIQQEADAQLIEKEISRAQSSNKKSQSTKMDTDDKKSNDADEGKEDEEDQAEDKEGSEAGTDKTMTDEDWLNDEEFMLKWRMMRYKPKFVAEETARAYQLEANIPGLNTEELVVSVAENGKGLHISGCRLPTARDIAALRRQVENAHMIDPHMSTFDRIHTEEELMLRLGAGNFGTFEQTVLLPPDADVQGTEAVYVRDLLHIAVPRKPMASKLPVQLMPGFGRRIPAGNEGDGNDDDAEGPSAPAGRKMPQQGPVRMVMNPALLQQLLRMQNAKQQMADGKGKKPQQQQQQQDQDVPMLFNIPPEQQHRVLQNIGLPAQLHVPQRGANAQYGADEDEDDDDNDYEMVGPGPDGSSKNSKPSRAQQEALLRALLGNLGRGQYRVGPRPVPADAGADAGDDDNNNNGAAAFRGMPGPAIGSRGRAAGTGIPGLDEALFKAALMQAVKEKQQQAEAGASAPSAPSASGPSGASGPASGKAGAGDAAVPEQLRKLFGNARFVRDGDNFYIIPQ